jgi:hypothetical protein
MNIWIFYLELQCSLLRSSKWYFIIMYYSSMDTWLINEINIFYIKYVSMYSKSTRQCWKNYIRCLYCVTCIVPSHYCVIAFCTLWFNLPHTLSRCMLKEQNSVMDAQIIVVEAPLDCEGYGNSVWPFGCIFWVFCIITRIQVIYCTSFSPWAVNLAHAN